MKFPLKFAPFAPLRPSLRESQEFRDFAKFLLAQALQEYHAQPLEEVFASMQDKQQWTRVADKERISVYKRVRTHKWEDPTKPLTSSRQVEVVNGRKTVTTNEKQPHGAKHECNDSWTEDPTGTCWSSSSCSSAERSSFPLSVNEIIEENSDKSNTSALTADPTSGLPMLQAIGTIEDGSLDDIMYGVLAANSSSMRIKSSYVGDQYVDARVLCELQSPTEHDPFGFIGIKWVVKSSGNLLVKPRDFVFLEYNGIKKCHRTHQRIGFHLIHSVELPCCPSLQKATANGIVRGRVHFCGLYAENTSRHSRPCVQVFARCRVDPQIKRFQAFAVNSVTNHLLSSLLKMTHCAELKRLQWLSTQNASLEEIQDKALQELPELDRHPNQHAFRDPLEQSMASSCGLYDGTNRVLAVVDRNNTRRCEVCASCQRFVRSNSSKQRICRMCHEVICKRCSISKKLSFDSSRRRVARLKRQEFCRTCIARSYVESSLVVAQAQVRARRLEQPHLHGVLAGAGAKELDGLGALGAVVGVRDGDDALSSEKESVSVAHFFDEGTHQKEHVVRSLGSTARVSRLSSPLALTDLTQQTLL